MNDDELLRTLGGQHRAEVERRAPEWADVAHGRCSAEQAAETVRGREGAEEAEIARAIELFAPLPEAFDDALVDRLAGGETPAHAGTSDTPDPPTDGAALERRDRAFWRRGAVGVAIAAAAAALVIVIVRPGSTPAGPGSDAVAQLRALPAFELGVQAVRATVRADHAAPAELQVAAGEAVELMLRPASRHGESPSVWACLDRDGTRTELRTEIVDEAAGATILARATIPEGTATGSWTLVAVVATERPTPDPCALTDAPTHRVLRSPISVVAPPR